MDNRLQYIAENLDAMTIGVDEPFKFHCDLCGKCCIHREDILLNAKSIVKPILGILPGYLSSGLSRAALLKGVP